MVLVNERTDTRGQAGLAELYRGGGADGALFVSVTIERRVAALVSKSPVPSVLLNRDVDGADVDRVMADNAGGAAQVAELLHGLGHRRIAFIAGPANTSTSRDREAGFSKALAQRGAPLDPALRRVGEFTHRSGYQWATDLLDRPGPPDRRLLRQRRRRVRRARRRAQPRARRCPTRSRSSASTTSPWRAGAPSASPPCASP